MTDGISDNEHIELDLYIITHGRPLASDNRFEEACNEVKWWNPGEQYHVEFSADEIRIPGEKCQIAYSDLCEPEFYSASTNQTKAGECHRRNVLRVKTTSGGLIYFYTDAQDGLKKGLFSNDLTEGTPLSFPSALKNHIQREIPDEPIGDAPLYILTEFVREAGGEYWVSGISEKSADIDMSGTATTSSTGIELGAITRSKAKSEISLSGNSSESRQREYISVFLVYSDRILIDGYYGEFNIRLSEIQHIGTSNVINIVTNKLNFEISDLNGRISVHEMKQH
jgi:hypothetical protein